MDCGYIWIYAYMDINDTYMDTNISILPIYGWILYMDMHIGACASQPACHSAMRPGMSTYLSPTGIEPVSST